MLEGFYSSLSGMLVQQRTLNVLSNNVVNVKTPGFKEERVISTTFHDELMVRTENGKKIPIGTGDPIRLVEDVVTNLESSSLEATNRPFDIAIVGNGFFNIATEDSQYLTRNGNFDIDTEGYLILAGAGRVMGENGNIQVSGSDFVVQPDGVVTQSDGTVIDKLLITQPEEGTQLEKFVNGLYVAPENLVPLDTDEFQTAQYNLETANYDINREYTLMMEAQRAFQACSSAFKMLDSISQKTATQIGNV